jgi:CSLREA domain-containing protein
MRSCVASLVFVLTSMFALSATASTIVVTTTADTLADDGLCSLREAIIASNTDAAVGGCVAGAGSDVVDVPAGVYLLAIAGQAEDASVSGDLDLVDTVRLVGAGARQTIIDANGLDRVLHILSPSTVEALTLRNGVAGAPYQRGGGALVSVPTLFFGAAATLSGLSIENNVAEMGAGLFLDQSRVHLSDSYVGDNGSTYLCGGIYFFYGLAEVTNTTVARNTAVYGGGLCSWYGTASISSSTITQNTASAPGDANQGNAGGIFINWDSAEQRITLRNTIVAGNRSAGFEQDLGCNRLSATGRLGSDGYNSIGSGTAAFHGCTFVGELTGNVVGDPGLVGPEDFGGETDTYALASGSSAVNSGTCQAIGGATLATDQRGASRADGLCDRGAYERGTCGDGLGDDGEDCDLGAANSDLPDAACRTTCFAQGCGDGIIDTAEACDDGEANSDAADTCRTSCELPSCGDGIVDSAEQCDSNTLGYAADQCRPGCVAPTCGDGITDSAEQCDDAGANGDEPDLCRLSCDLPTCGDLIVDSDEACDDGDANADAANACRTSCDLPACGDGIADSGEECDARVLGYAADQCRPGCILPVCGDGTVDAGEACDDAAGNADEPNRCRPGCELPTCGDAIVDDGELCDEGDNNGETGALCRVDCVVPYCGDGLLDDGEQCDDGSGNGDFADSCRVGCLSPWCGDGVVDDGEECDEAGENSDEPDACRPDCVLPGCGDGVVDDGEVCDDNDANSDVTPGACTTTCGGRVPLVDDPDAGSDAGLDDAGSDDVGGFDAGGDADLDAGGEVDGDTEVDAGDAGIDATDTGTTDGGNDVANPDAATDEDTSETDVGDDTADHDSATADTTDDSNAPDVPEGDAPGGDVSADTGGQSGGGGGSGGCAALPSDPSHASGLMLLGLLCVARRRRPRVA